MVSVNQILKEIFQILPFAHVDLTKAKIGYNIYVNYSLEIMTGMMDCYSICDTDIRIKFYQKNQKPAWSFFYIPTGNRTTYQEENDKFLEDLRGRLLELKPNTRIPTPNPIIIKAKQAWKKWI